jgi:hypothetical protein
VNELCAIVINYFAPDATRRCLDSLRSEVFDTVRVIDNSADPEANQAFLKMIASFEEEPPPWELIVSVNDENLGFGRAINRAIQADRSRGSGHRRYLLMNNDAVGKPNFAAGLVEKANESEAIALVTPRILWGNEVVGLRWYHRLTAHISTGPLPGSFSYATGCCLLVDERLLDEDGRLFDEDFFMYGEDVLLTWKARQRGFEVVCADAVTVEHEGSASAPHGDYFYEYHVTKGHWILGRKLYGDLWDRASIKLCRRVYLAIRALLRSLRFRNIVAFRALRLAIRS